MKSCIFNHLKAASFRKKKICMQNPCEHKKQFMNHGGIFKRFDLVHDYIFLPMIYV